MMSDDDKGCLQILGIAGAVFVAVWLLGSLFRRPTDGVKSALGSIDYADYLMDSMERREYPLETYNPLRHLSDTDSISLSMREYGDIKDELYDARKQLEEYLKND